MVSTDYEHILAEIQGLSLQEQVRLLEKTALLLRHKVVNPPARSIVDLRGKGKEMWSSLDVEAYLERERQTWDG